MPCHYDDGSTDYEGLIERLLKECVSEGVMREINQNDGERRAVAAIKLLQVLLESI